jgi:hypothetical protein
MLLGCYGAHVMRIMILFVVSCQNTLMKVIEVYDWNSYLHIITEDWSSDNDRMYGFRSLTEGMVANVILSLTSAVRYMHERQCVVSTCHHNIYLKIYNPISNAVS